MGGIAHERAERRAHLVDEALDVQIGISEGAQRESFDDGDDGLGPRREVVMRQRAERGVLCEDFQKSLTRDRIGVPDLGGDARAARGLGQHLETIDDQLDAQEALVAAASDGLRLAEARFRGGVDSYLPVLDAQRALYQSQQGLIAVRLARGANAVSLYRALGGGWTPELAGEAGIGASSAVTAPPGSATGAR